MHFQRYYRCYKDYVLTIFSKYVTTYGRIKKKAVYAESIIMTL